jgi:predicted transcriptional regulator
MITHLDFELLTFFAKKTPVKEIIKQGYYSTNVYEKIRKYKKNHLIKKINSKPVTYATTFKGAIILSTLEDIKEML